MKEKLMCLYIEEDLGGIYLATSLFVAWLAKVTTLDSQACRHPDKVTTI